MQINRELERGRIEALAKVLRCRHTRDECGDFVLHGRCGNVHVDGAGYSVAVMLESPRQWRWARQRLQRFCELRQDGDWEGVLHMPGLPTPAQAKELRGVLRLRRIRECSPDQVARLRKMAFARAIKAGVQGKKRAISVGAVSLAGNANSPSSATR